ncbi:MAG: hypothetical protein GYA23_09545 [Methanomicrobiales archaeon]|nr:hypothetical protein [Methanomicrobiales archaeon]
MPAPHTKSPEADEALSAAFSLIFHKGRSPPSCPVPDDNDLLNRIRDAVPQAPPKACRDALVRVRRLSFDVTEVCGAFLQGDYGEGADAKAAALADLETKDPGFSEAEYFTAFAVGLMWAQLQQAGT